jgi:peptidoglycan DL-endopeptidase CwlO
LEKSCPVFHKNIQRRKVVNKKMLNSTFATALVLTIMVVGSFLSVNAQDRSEESPSKSEEAPSQAVEAPSQVVEAPTAVADADSEPILVEGKGAGKTHHVFPAGYCTRYAADTFRSRTGKIVTWRGDAKYWLANAAKEGYRTSTSKYNVAKNAIIVFGATRTNSYGHVAIIDSISTDGKTLVLSEMNWKGFGIKSTRKINFTDLDRLQFIGVILPY